MQYVSRLSFVLAAIGVCLSSPAASTDIWRGFRSENFVLYSDIEPSKGRALIGDLETFRYTLGELTNTSDIESKLPLVIYGFADDRDYLEVSGLKNSAGIYVSQIDGPVSIVNLDEPKEQWHLTGRQILFHEYVHHFLRQYSAYNYPRWYDEGFAEYLATFEVKDGRGIVGSVHLYRAVHLKSSPHWISYRAIIESHDEYLRIKTRTRRDKRRFSNDRALQYSQGWLLTHYLSSSSERLSKLKTYIRAVNDGADSLGAFEKIFDIDIRELDELIEAYWQEGRLRTLIVDLDAFEVPNIEVTRFDTVRSRYLLAEARLKILDDSDRSVKNEFEDALERNPDDARARLNLARYHIIAGDVDEAAAELAQMTEETTMAARFHKLHGDLLTARAVEAQNVADKEPLLTAARNAYVEAIRTDPLNTGALFGYANSYLIDEQTKPDSAAVSVLESADYLLPRNQTVQLARAKLLARVGRTKEAVDILKSMIKWSTSNESAKRISEILDKLSGDPEDKPEDDE